MLHASRDVLYYKAQTSSIQCPIGSHAKTSIVDTAAVLLESLLMYACGAAALLTLQ